MTPSLACGKEHAPLLAAGLVALVTMCLGCQSIVGIRERELGSNASAVSTECQEFCSRVDTACKEVGVRAYIKPAACEAVCDNLDPPDAGSLTLSCLDWNAGALSEPSACEAAGPSGGGKCGERCAVYCRLYNRICERYPAGTSATECQNSCAVLDIGGGISADAAFEGSDTLQCRFAHLAAAAEESLAGHEPIKEMHCRHALVNPFIEPKCFDKVPRCERYCAVVTNACLGTNQQYATSEQCQAVCERFPDTKPSETAATPLECRMKAAYGALIAPGPELCMEAGPGGGGNSNNSCAGSCRGYCELLSQACATAGFEAYKSDRPIDACTDECNSMGHATHMRRFKCRLDNIAEALATSPNDKALCDNAFGRGMCGPGTGQ